jgi:hypothetical protein
MAFLASGFAMVVPFAVALRKPLHRPKKSGPARAEPDRRRRQGWDQRPKNSHKRMITGIGTPSSQSKSPRPIVVASMI